MSYLNLPEISNLQYLSGYVRSVSLNCMATASKPNISPTHNLSARVLKTFNVLKSASHIKCFTLWCGFLVLVDSTIGNREKSADQFRLNGGARPCAMSCLQSYNIVNSYLYKATKSRWIMGNWHCVSFYNFKNLMTRLGVQKLCD